MLRYQSRRHQRLMDESELALRDAANSTMPLESRIARDTLDDDRTYRHWEETHAELVRPIAEQSRRSRQVFEIRELDVQLVHKRALIDHIRRQQLLGKDRERMIAAFYGPKDIRDAILAEHRKYTLAVSSGLSANHLIRVMSDPVGIGLVKLYESVYTKYFDLYGFVVLADDPVWADALKPMMQDLRQQALRLRKRIHEDQPGKRLANFDRQALLARSGRYPVLDYMVR